MGEPLARVGRWSKGYAVGEVDRFLDLVEARLAGAAAGDGEPVTAEEIRRAGFTLVRGGYDVEQVDRRLDDLEERALEAEGVPAAAAEDGEALEALRDLAGAPAGERFSRAGVVGRGYDVDDVDALCDRLLGQVAGVSGPAVTVADVREAVFRERLHGYDEDEVDAFLDAVVGVLLRRGRASA